MLLNNVRSFILNQFEEEETQKYLTKISTENCNFIERCRQSFDFLLPFLCSSSKELASDIEKDCNYLLNLCQNIEHREIANPFCIPNIYRMSSQTVSLYIQNALKYKSDSKLLVNGENSYPDLYLNFMDYQNLPKGSKSLTAETINHPYQQRWLIEPIRPNKVPDGLELKATSQNKINIMTHGPHAGLHLVIQWQIKEKFSIRNILLGFLNSHKYKTYNIKTEADTRKYFFDNKHLISLI